MATIGEFLLIKIGIDNDKLKKDADKAKKNIESVEKKVEEFKNTLKKFTRTSLIEFFTALASAAGITAFISNVTKADAALGRLSKTTGMSVEAISAWSNAAERAGGSAAEMQSGIANMSKELTNFKYTGESTLVPFLAQMGVSIVDVNGKLKDQNQIMLELADRAQNMPKEDFANLAMANGFNQSQVNLMLQGRKALQQQINEQNRNAITTKQQAEQAQKLETAWIDLKQSFMGVARQIAYVLVPPLTVLFKVLAAIFTFIGTHKLLMYSMFALAIPKVLGFVKMLTLVMRTFNLLTPIIKVATLAMRGFGISSALALAPLLLLGAGIALLFDDFMTFQAGGDSLIPWDKVFGGAKTAIQDIKDLIFSVGTLMDLLKAVGQGDWKAAASLGKKLMMDATPIGMAAKVTDRVVTGGKNVDAVNKEAAAASEQVKNPTPSKRQQQPTSVQNSGDGFVDNSALRGLKIKSSEATAGGRVHGYVADFAKLYQKDNEANLKYFSAFNDSYHKGRKSDHNIGKAFDIVLKNANSSERAKAIKSMKENAAKYGYDIKIIDEYAKPSAHSTGGHIHVSVKGRKGAISSVTSGATTSASNVLFGGVGEPYIVKVLEATGNIRKYLRSDGSIETRTGGTRAWRNNNPGNLRFSDFSKSAGAVGEDGNTGIGKFSIFKSLKDGLKAKEKLIFESQNYKNLDLKSAINRYAPPNENDTGWYYKSVFNSVGANKKMSNYTEAERQKILSAMLKVEGFKAGKVIVTNPNGGFLTAGARGQATLSSGGANVNSVHSETHIGNININTMATDAVGVAKAIPHEIKNQYSKLAHAVSSGMS